MTTRQRAWLLVAVAVVGISLSAPLTAATAAPALAVAFWRTALGTTATLPWALVRHRDELRSLPLRAVGGCVISGLLLAVHFGLWMPSLRMTSVTASTALVATIPVWTVAIERFLGVRPARAVLLGVGLAIVGVLAISGADAGRSARALAGDALAVVSGLAAGGYVVVGERVRRSTSTAAYTLLVYGICALALVPVCLLLRVPFAGYASRTWFELALVTVSAQLLGHSAFTIALPTIGATPLSLATLLEVPGAALVAWGWLGQVPPAGVAPGTLLLLLGLVVVVRSRSHAPTVPL